MKQLALLCLAVIALVACSEEDAPTVEALGMTITEEAVSNAGKVERTEEFYYNKARKLTRHVLKQKFTVEIGGHTDTDSIQIENRVTYAPNEATVTDASDNVSTYLLNEKGYATSCIRREGEGAFIRNYTFNYAPDGVLAEVQETINGKTESRIILQPLTETTATLRTEIGEVNSTFLLSFNEENTSRLPWLYYTDLYPLNLHQDAMYAQLLGKSPARLIHSIQPETGDERTTYTYTTDAKGDLRSCTESIHSYGITNRRTVNYSIALPN